MREVFRCYFGMQHAKRKIFKCPEVIAHQKRSWYRGLIESSEGIEHDVEGASVVWVKGTTSGGLSKKEVEIMLDVLNNEV